MWALENVRMKHGSTQMSFAPRSMAFVTHLKEIGWFSAPNLVLSKGQSTPSGNSWICL